MSNGTHLNISDNTVNNNEIDGDLIIGYKFEIKIPKVNPQSLINLIERSKKLSEQDEEYKNFIDELNSFLEPRPSRKIIGLEGKLKEANRLDLLEDAQYLENKFARRVAKGQLSRSAQAVYFHCLSKINTTFSSQIQPLIRSGADKKTVDAAIFICIIEPLYEEVSVADSSISTEMIRGMLYFITGKCHTRWV